MSNLFLPTVLLLFALCVAGCGKKNSISGVYRSTEDSFSPNYIVIKDDMTASFGLFVEGESQQVVELSDGRISIFGITFEKSEDSEGQLLTSSKVGNFRKYYETEEDPESYNIGVLRKGIIGDWYSVNNLFSSAELDELRSTTYCHFRVLSSGEYILNTTVIDFVNESYSIGNEISGPWEIDKRGFVAEGYPNHIIYFNDKLKVMTFRDVIRVGGRYRPGQSINFYTQKKYDISIPEGFREVSEGK